VSIAFLNVAVSYDAATIRRMRRPAAQGGVGALFPGDTLTGRARREHLEALGYDVHDDGIGFTVPGDVAQGAVRHLTTLASKRRKGEALSDQEACGASDARCPLLAAAGIPASDVMMARVSNTRERRNSSLPCPHCIVPCGERDARGEAEKAGAYDAATHRFRDAAGRLKGA